MSRAPPTARTWTRRVRIRCLLLPICRYGHAQASFPPRATTDSPDTSPHSCPRRIVEIFLGLDAWANTRAVTRGDSKGYGAVASEHDDLKNASCDNAAHGYAPVQADEFPLRITASSDRPCASPVRAGENRRIREQHLVGRRVEPLRAKRVHAFVQKLRAKVGDGAAKPAYIFTEHGVGYRMPRPGSAGLRTPFRERRRRAPDTRPLPRSKPRPASRRGRGAGIVPDKVGGDALRNPHRRIAHRSLRQMRIARGRLDLRVTEQAPDHRQALPERQRP